MSDKSGSLRYGCVKLQMDYTSKWKSGWVDKVVSV